MKKLLLAFLVCCIASVTALAGDTARVLFIGNSFTAGMPEVLTDFAAANGDVLISVNAQVMGGQTLQGFSANPATIAAIDAGGYDYMVLQEQSQAPAFPNGQVATDFYPYAKALVSRMRLKSPCSKPMFYMTWGYRTGDPTNCAAFPLICTYAGMDSLLRRRYMIVSDSNDALLTPAGAVWRKIRSSYPHINLYAGDDRHPSDVGTYANACAFYAAIFGKSPVGNPFFSTINPADAALIQGAAKSVVYDSLGYWRQWWKPSFQPKAQFLTFISGWKVQFAGSSINAAKQTWYFGDGGTDTGANPTHNYSLGKSYTVRLIAESMCGDRDTLDKMLALSPAAVGNSNNSEGGPKVYPVPATTNVQFGNLAGRYTSLCITDISGRKILAAAIAPGADTHHIAIAHLQPGMYFAELRNASGDGVVLKWVKD